MYCIKISGPEYHNVVGPFPTAQEAAKFVDTRLMIASTMSAIVIKMMAPTDLDERGYQKHGHY